MLKHPDALKPAQKTLAHLLAVGTPPEEAARMLGVSKAYVEVLLRGGMFQTEVDTARRELIGERLDEYTKLVSEQLMPNLEALIAIRDDPESPPAARLRAIEMLNDTLVPKAAKKAGEPEARARVTFSVEQQQQAIGVMKEVAPTETTAVKLSREDRR
jgi:DNA-binding CsgD family transcriptional regulator